MYQQLEPKKGWMSWIALLFFLAVVVMSGIIAGYVPLYNDDLYYAIKYSCIDHTFCPDKHFDLFDQIIDHRANVNGRFGDMFVPIFVLIPNLLYGIIYGCCYGGIILLMNRIARVSFTRDPIKVMWLTGMTVLFFPWPDTLYSRVCFINYFPSALLTLYVVKNFISRRRLKRWQTWLCIFAAFLVGWWHELVPVTLFPSAIVFCVITRSITRKQFLISVAVVTGFIMAMTAPSFFSRTDQLATLQLEGYIIRYCLIYIICNAVLSIIALIACYKGKAHKREKALVWALLTPQLPAAIIMMTSLYECRMLLFSTILILTALIRSLPNMIGRLKYVISGLTLIVSTILLIHLGTVGKNMRKVFLASEEVFAQAKADKDNVIYFDLTSLLEYPEYLFLYKTIGNAYISQYSSDIFKDYARRNSNLIAVPPVFRDFDSSKAEKIEGPIAAYYKDSYLAIPFPVDDTPERIHYGCTNIEYVNGEILKNNFAGYEFRDKNGKKFIYLLFTYPIRKRSKPKRILEFNFFK